MIALDIQLARWFRRNKEITQANQQIPFPSDLREKHTEPIDISALDTTRLNPIQTRLASLPWYEATHPTNFRCTYIARMSSKMSFRNSIIKAIADYQDLYIGRRTNVYPCQIRLRPTLANCLQAMLSEREKAGKELGIFEKIEIVPDITIKQEQIVVKGN